MKVFELGKAEFPICNFNFVYHILYTLSLTHPTPSPRAVPYTVSYSMQPSWCLQQGKLFCLLILWVANAVPYVYNVYKTGPVNHSLEGFEYMLSNHNYVPIYMVGDVFLSVVTMYMYSQKHANHGVVRVTEVAWAQLYIAGSGNNLPTYLFFIMETDVWRGVVY